MTDWPLELVHAEGSGKCRLRQYLVGPGKNFVYLIGDAVSRKAVVVDPAWNPIGLADEAARLGFELVGILVTHSHVDHLGGIIRHQLVQGARELFEDLRLPVWVHEAEADRVVRFAEIPDEWLRPFRDEEILSLGSLAVTCLHTPGHSPGGACYVVAGSVLTGDTLFVRNIGNCEHPLGDIDAMYASLSRLSQLPEETRIYSGHDYGDEPSSTIGLELQRNAYMRPMKLEQFRILMGVL